MKQKLFLYPIYMADVPPHFTLEKAFQKHFDTTVCDWVNIAKTIGLPANQQEFLEILKIEKPDYCFMQLQNPVNMSVEMVREMAKHTKIINWTGDVKHSDEWYKWLMDIGDEIYLTLFTNKTQPKILNLQGVRADYLQVGYDTGWYNPEPLPTDDQIFKDCGSPEIVFCANNNPAFPEVVIRKHAVIALTEQFRDKFRVFGAGWDSLGIKTRFVDNTTEATLYRNAKIALSISNYSMESYWSDRLPRILGCGGAVALSHNFPGIRENFEEDLHLYVFNTIPNLINKCHDILKYNIDRYEVRDTALALATTQHTWDYRVKELKDLLEKYEQLDSAQ